MISDPQKFKAILKDLLLSDEGLAVESEGTVFIRSLEGNRFAAGTHSDEIEFGEDLDAAIEYFVKQRQAMNHGCCPLD